MNLKIKILVAILFLIIAASATETTWRHPGFEVASFDVNFSSTFNITELRVLEWGWNSSTPSASNANRAIMYYDNNNKKIMQSINGGGYEEVMTNVSNGSTLFGLNMSNQTRCTANITCTYEANGSLSLNANSNITAIFNQILNTSTVTVGRNANGSVELTSSSTAATDVALTASPYNQTTILSSIAVGDTSGTANTAGNIRYTSINTTTNGNVSTLDINMNSGTQTNITMALYTDSAGLPDTLIGQTRNVSTTGAGWNNLSISIPPLKENTRYWIAMQESATNAFNQNSTASEVSYYQSYANYGSFPATASGLSSTYNQANTRITFINRSVSTQYSNRNTTNSILLQVTMSANISTGSASGGKALFWCASDSSSPPSTRISGQVGIEKGVVNQDQTTQVTCIIRPNMNYAINVSTSGGGNLLLRDWQEFFI